METNITNREVKWPCTWLKSLLNKGIMKMYPVQVYRWYFCSLI